MKRKEGKSLTLRDIPEGLHHDLVKRAKDNNRSMQGEVLTILQEALYPLPSEEGRHGA